MAAGHGPRDGSDPGTDLHPGMRSAGGDAGFRTSGRSRYRCCAGL